MTDNNRDILADKNFFLILLSYQWSSNERAVLKDCQSILENGGQVYLYIFKDSPMDYKAREMNVHCFYHQGGIATSFFKWKRLKSVARLLADYHIDLVHCYDIKVLWPLCYFLKGKPLIPLVLTMNRELTRFYRGFWYQPLNRRLDQVLTVSPALNENIWGNLGIPPIKVSPIGFAVREGERDKGSKPSFLFDDQSWYVGTNVSGTEKDAHFLDDLFYAIQVLMGQKIADKKIVFVLINEKLWSECLVTDDLRRRVKDWGLEHHVAFIEGHAIEDIQCHLDLWVSTKTDEVLEDYAISALINGLPSILPRHHCSMELLRQYGSVGETYKAGDTRSLRQKCELVLKNYASYQKVLKQEHHQLSERFSFSFYQQTLAKNYHQLIKRRLRLMRSRKRKTFR